MNDDTITFKPCPFCGSQDVGLMDDIVLTVVECRACGVMGPSAKHPSVNAGPPQTHCVEFWNSRGYIEDWTELEGCGVSPGQEMVVFGGVALPCPFCGSKHIVGLLETQEFSERKANILCSNPMEAAREAEISEGTGHASCLSCGTITRMNIRKIRILEEWNRRASGEFLECL